MPPYYWLWQRQQRGGLSSISGPYSSASCHPPLKSDPLWVSLLSPPIPSLPQISLPHPPPGQQWLLPIAAAHLLSTAILPSSLSVRQGLDNCHCPPCLVSQPSRRLCAPRSQVQQASRQASELPQPAPPSPCQRLHLALGWSPKQPCWHWLPMRDEALMAGQS